MPLRCWRSPVSYGCLPPSQLALPSKEAQPVAILTAADLRIATCLRAPGTKPEFIVDSEQSMQSSECEAGQIGIGILQKSHRQLATCHRSGNSRGPQKLVAREAGMEEATKHRETLNIGGIGKWVHHRVEQKAVATMLLAQTVKIGELESRCKKET
jgi:hypothetical protein